MLRAMKRDGNTSQAREEFLRKKEADAAAKAALPRLLEQRRELGGATADRRTDYHPR